MSRQLTMPELKRRFSKLVDVAATLDASVCALVEQSRKGHLLSPRGLEVARHFPRTWSLFAEGRPPCP